MVGPCHHGMQRLHNLYSSLNIKVIKSRGIRWAGHVTRMGEEKIVYSFWLGGR
jgi:hypothetical protein